MPSPNAAELPNLAEVLSPVLQGVPVEQQPLLIAIAERMAAQRYREWAKDAAMQRHYAELLACADREEQIASRVEGLYPQAAAMQRAIRANNPNLEETNRTLFAGRPLAQQFTIQAQGERLGAATWRAFARHEQNDARRAAFLACAELEEDSARALDAILDGKRQRKTI